MITNENEREILKKLNELLEIEVHELQRYSETSTCSNAKQGMEDEYNYQKNKVRLVLDIKNINLFSSLKQKTEV
ncbi:MAG: hypothetical protein FWD71_14315 [Oscillospiraceae bacterium]|nr:hypothetical protein [Oscillospiraceae bacterium]